MALIDYKCSKCGHEFFEIVKGDTDKIICPKCGSDETQRIYKGKFYGSNGGSCGGGCSTCSGCGH